MPFIGPNDGEALVLGGNPMLVKLSHRRQAGFSLIEHTIAPGWRAPGRHIHDKTEEVFYVVQGRLTFEVDGETQEAGPRTTVHVPSGAVHNWWNATDEPAIYVGTLAPGGHEEFFRELSRLYAAGHRPGDDAMNRLVAEHDVRPA